MQYRIARKTPLLAAAFAITLLAVPNVWGQTCSDATFQGTYAFRASGTNLAAGGAPVHFAGSIEANGMGAIVAWKDWVALPAQDAVPPQFKDVPPLRDIYELSGQDIRYSVEDDCRIEISAIVEGPLGPVPVRLVGALASAGREALLINGSAGSPFLTTATMKRSDDARIDAIEKALRRIGERFGLLLDFEALRASGQL
jgi:hypothetical protein